MRNTFSLLFVLTVFSSGSLADGAEPSTPAKLKNAAALRELRKHEVASKALEVEQQEESKILAGKHAVEKNEIRDRTVQALKKLQKAATLANRLDDALAIRNAIKELDQPAKKEHGIPAGAASFKDHRYLGVHINNVTWDQARQLCEKMGGHLVIIESPEEHTFLKSLVGPFSLWIGARKVKGKYQWIDGSDIPQGLWHEGRIKGDKDGSYYVYILRGGPIWNTWSPHTNIPGFVCEWDR